MQTKLFINGKFVDAVAGGKIAVLNPYDNSEICQIAEAREADVDAAVEAAKAAQKRWDEAARRSVAGCCSSWPTPSRRTPKN